MGISVYEGQSIYYLGKGTLEESFVCKSLSPIHRGCLEGQGVGRERVRLWIHSFAVSRVYVRVLGFRGLQA